MFDPELTTLVVNPAAAGGRVGKNWSELEPQLRDALGSVRIAHTAAVGDAMRLTREAVEGGSTTILSLGGDGTHNEVTNGIMTAGPEPGAVTLGIIPSGTGGDFRRLLTTENDIMDAARAVPNGTIDRIDVGSLTFADDQGETTTRYFLNIASFGMGGLVDRYVNASSKRLGGRATFLLATLRGLGAYTPARVHIEVDGEDIGEHEIMNVAVANGRYFGGGMNAAPAARLADGQFDLTIIAKASLATMVLATPKLYDGTIIDMAHVTTLKGRHVVARPVSSDPAYLDIDGEAPGLLPAEFHMHEGAIGLLNARRDVL